MGVGVGVELAGTFSFAFCGCVLAFFPLAFFPLAFLPCFPLVLLGEGAGAAAVGVVVFDCVAAEVVVLVVAVDTAGVSGTTTGTRTGGG